MFNKAASGVGLQIKLLRTARGLRQRDLAQRVGLSPSILSDIENGWRTPTADEVAALFTALGVGANASEAEK
jgi:transcriptional regulator with XRE-family HTH domain